jgi:hypothetical protein
MVQTPAAYDNTIVSGSPLAGTALLPQILMSGGPEMLADDANKAGEPTRAATATPGPR